MNKEHFKSITWSPADLFNNNGINDGILKNAEELIPGHTYTYRYDITNTCNSASGLLFLTSFKDKNVNPKNAEIKICYENASDIQLNDILGIEASGSWSCLTGNASAYLKTNLPAPHAGLAVFDGKSAWEDDSIPYDSNNNKIITIDYTTSADSCIGEKTATITIILTPDLT